jgi:hypothetical protein
VLHDVCGLKLSAGGLSQALDRLADRLEPDYQQLFADVRAGPAVYVDEKSWWVGGPASRRLGASVEFTCWKPLRRRQVS